MVLFVPGAIGWFFFAWANQGAIDAMHTPMADVVVWGPLGIPLVLATALGSYSLIFSGGGPRNILGLIGTTAATIVLAAWLYLIVMIIL
jgi:hypothetical protein